MTISTTDTITELTKRVARLEQTVFEPKASNSDLSQHNSTAMRRQIFQTLLQQQGITNQPIGAEALQKLLEHEQLDMNEMSRSVREMREE